MSVENNNTDNNGTNKDQSISEVNSSRDHPNEREKGLDERAEIIVPADSGAILIPESEFMRSLEEANSEKENANIASSRRSIWASRILRIKNISSPKIFGIDSVTRLKAVKLAGMANKPGTLGIIGNLQQRKNNGNKPLKFKGKLFIVLHDSVINQNEGTIESTDYEVAAVELSGSSNILGISARFAVAQPDPSDTSADRCCGPETICTVDPEFMGTDPGSWADLRPSEDVGVSTIIPKELEPRMRSGSVVKLTLFVNDRSSNRDRERRRRERAGENELNEIDDMRIPELADEDPPEPLDGGVVPEPVSCVNVLDEDCTKIEPICEEGDPGYTKNEEGNGDGGSGSDPCKDPTPSYRVRDYVLEICTMIDDWGRMPIECGGLCEHCEEFYSAAHRVPPYCKVIEPVPESDACDPQIQEDIDAKNWNLQTRIGWSGGYQEQCQTGSRGMQRCIVCNGDGDCHEEARRPMVDPTVVSTGDDEDEDDENEDNTQTQFVGETRVVPNPTDPSKTDYVIIDKDGNELARVPYTTSEESNSPTGTPPVTNANPNEPLPPKEPTEIKTTPTPSNSPEGPINREPRDMGPDKTSTAGDPIRLIDGSLHMDQTDLSFDTPTGVFQFIRSYNSNSDTRSTMGSNWIHNWDVHIQTLNSDTNPSWASPYCAGTPHIVTSLILYEGDGSATMFFLDPQTKIFMPQAGSTDTVLRTEGGGWVLRKSDGYVRYFNMHGYLEKEHDRFGNGFKIEYEATPLFELYQHFCDPGKLAVENETKYSRRYAVLSYFNEETRKPEFVDSAWELYLADFPLDPKDPTLSPGLYDRLVYARTYFMHLLSLGPDSENVYGFRKLRPTKVTDNLGRVFEFSYYHAPPSQRFQSNYYDIDNDPYDFTVFPQAELLSEVKFRPSSIQDPISSIKFTYSRPSFYPKELNELFLVKVERNDIPMASDIQPAANRQVGFIYQWPHVSSESYNSYDDLVNDRYTEYYKSFVGCTYSEITMCMQGEVFGTITRADGDFKALARRERNGYISKVADNIVQVINNGTIESESRYVTDPRSPMFEHIRAQRYGSSHAQPYGILSNNVPVDQQNDRWQTSLPKAVMEYCDAGHVIGNPNALDNTDLFLPVEIRERYALESLPTPTRTSSSVPTVRTAIGAGEDPCEYDKMRELRKRLPGWKEEIHYFDAMEEEEASPNRNRRLYRSRLSPEQLALAQMSDPTHNDLLSSLGGPREIGTTSQNPTELTSKYYWQRVVGRRDIIASNMNRICSWTKVIDRDGDIHFYGLNYRGQILVEAIKEHYDSPHFIFTEYVYNADGFLVQTRRPSRGQEPWSPANGYTQYKYDEIVPTENNGWNNWLPLFWSRRGNLIEEAVYGGANNPILDFDEESNTFDSSSVGRFTRYTYEPLFNQLRSVQSGSIKTGFSRNSRGLPVPTLTFQTYSATDYLFDYQELSLEYFGNISESSSLDPLLDELRKYGFDWITTSNDTYSYGDITQWQLPLIFYGRDLNFDGILGFGPDNDETNTDVSSKIRGVPVLAIERSRGQSSEFEFVRASHFSWSPHGKLGKVMDSDGRLIIFRYYSIKPSTRRAAGPYGQDMPPLGTDVSSGYRGFLARVKIKRFSSDFPLSYGPPGRQPCPQLAGPYQWLLPPKSNSPSDDLRTLGLPSETIDAILESAQDPSTSTRGRWISESFSYSVTGKRRYVWRENIGASLHIERDTDGREVKVTDQLGISKTTRHTINGFPQIEVRTDASGQRIGGTVRQFDEEGHVILEYIALSQQSQNFGDPNLTNPVAGIITRYQYSPEGLLRFKFDPEELITEYKYNERKLLVEEKYYTAYRPDMTGIGFIEHVYRKKMYEHDLDGDITTIHYGDPSWGHLEHLSEHLLYDGLKRVKAFTNTRNYDWQLAYSKRDLLVRVKRDDIPYGDIREAFRTRAPIREKVNEYDHRGLLKARYINGILTEKYEHTNQGTIYSSSGAGYGISYITYDLLGQPLWKIDPAGNQTVYTWRPGQNISSTSNIRRDNHGNTHTTATIDYFNTAGFHTRQVIYGSGIRQISEWDYDGSGFIKEEKDAAGFVKRYERNWLGWPLQIQEQKRTTGAGLAEFDIATFEYNGRGQVSKITDPNNQNTIINYFPDGSVKDRLIPGNPPVFSSYTYDRIGRLEKEVIGSVEISHTYDQRGDPIGDSFFNGNVFEPFIERHFDELARLRRSANYNPGLPWLSILDRTVTLNYDYDALGRVTSERVQIGRGVPRNIVSNWSSNSTSGRNGWLREVKYSTDIGETSWVDAYDQVGRLSYKSRTSSQNATAQIRTIFNWLGDIYTGRIQDQDDTQSPFREYREIDALGLLKRLEYTSIDLKQSKEPIHESEGIRYCGGQWNRNECGNPLFQIDIHRDILGRIASLASSFGYPVFDNSGSLLSGSGQMVPQWRGYVYTAQGFLDKVWKYSGAGVANITSGLRSYSVTEHQMQSISASVGAEERQYVREAAVGSLDRIVDSRTGQTPWSINSPRNPGYQIVSAEIGGTPFTVVHDVAGRIAEDGKFKYAYDAIGRLSSISDTRTDTFIEGYAYDSLGRLCAVFDGNQIRRPSLCFLYDGVKIVGAFNAHNKIIWEASWGPATDQLIEWRNHAESTGDYIPLVDHRNCIVAGWNVQVARVTQTAEYSPEGRLLVRDANSSIVCQEIDRSGHRRCLNPSNMPFGFVSAWRSSSTGLIYMRNRWYSPELSQFMSHDPSLFKDGYNPYAYARFDPINNQDPFGAESSGFTSESSDGPANSTTAVDDNPSNWEIFIDVLRRLPGDLMKTSEEREREVRGVFERAGNSPLEAAGMASEFMENARKVGESIDFRRRGWGTTGPRGPRRSSVERKIGDLPVRRAIPEGPQGSSRKPSEVPKSTDPSRTSRGIGGPTTPGGGDGGGSPPGGSNNGSFSGPRRSFVEDMTPEERARYEKYWKKHAPEVSSPYDYRRQYTESGDIKSVTTYDRFGYRHRRYDFIDPRRGEHQHNWVADPDKPSQTKRKSIDHLPIDE